MTFSRTFTDALRCCARRLVAVTPPAIPLHDLRHTHATIIRLLVLIRGGAAWAGVAAGGA